ncbi:unnamed protein product [Hymenolepis diminuta]|nr:unnamed protein product [Hymenolepis diminuta]
MREIAHDMVCKHPIYDRFFIKERNSNIIFVIDSGSPLCFIPTTYFSGEQLELTSWIKTTKGRSISIYGQKELIVDLGLERKMKWRFFLADITEPLIGADFLVHYDLQIDLRMKKLVANANTANENDLADENDLVNENDLSNPKIEDQESNTNRCLYIFDKNSGLRFLIDSGARRSQIPLITNESLTPLPYSRFIKANGSFVAEYGYKYLTVDLGFEDRFPWNFIMTDNVMPLIGTDFLTHYDLRIDLRRRKLIKRQSE